MKEKYSVTVERGARFYLSVDVSYPGIDEDNSYATVLSDDFTEDLTSTFVIPKTGLVSDDGTEFRQKFRAASVGLYWIHFHLLNFDGVHISMDVRLTVTGEKLDRPVLKPVEDKPRVRVIRFRRKVVKGA